MCHRDVVSCMAWLGTHNVKKKKIRSLPIRRKHPLICPWQTTLRWTRIPIPRHPPKISPPARKVRWRDFPHGCSLRKFRCHHGQPVTIGNALYLLLSFLFRLLSEVDEAHEAMVAELGFHASPGSRQPLPPSSSSSSPPPPLVSMCTHNYQYFILNTPSV